jgi:hypothetical protein
VPPAPPMSCRPTRRRGCVLPRRATTGRMQERPPLRREGCLSQWVVVDPVGCPTMGSDGAGSGGRALSWCSGELPSGTGPGPADPSTIARSSKHRERRHRRRWSVVFLFTKSTQIFAHKFSNKFSFWNSFQNFPLKFSPFVFQNIFLYFSRKFVYKPFWLTFLTIFV